MTYVDFMLVGIGVAVVLLAVVVTAIWQRQEGIKTRLSALENEVGVAWADQRLPKTLFKRMLTMELRWDLRRRK